MARTYANGNAYEMTCSAVGMSESGAICPAKMNEVRWSSVFTVLMRCSQNVAVATTQPIMKLKAAASTMLGTNSARCHHSPVHFTWNVSAMTRQTSMSGRNVVTFQMRFSTTE